MEALNTEATTLYKNYQNEVVFLSQEQKKKRQEAIMQKEKEASELKRKYFGPEGELFKKRTSLMTPIQEEIYNAVKDISEQRGYSLVVDRAANAGIMPEAASGGEVVPATPEEAANAAAITEIDTGAETVAQIDISNEVLEKLGYGNQ